jgi:hypothetical protein
MSKIQIKNHPDALMIAISEYNYPCNGTQGAIDMYLGYSTSKYTLRYQYTYTNEYTEL